MGSVPEAALKTCSTCRTEKPLEGFVRDAGRPDGRYTRCKDCSREYYQQNSSQIRATNQEYREKNRARVRAWNERYNIRRYFFTKARTIRQRANGEPCATYKQLAQLWKFQRGVCALTGVRLNREIASIDHVIPLVRGGTSTIENLRWVTYSVNLAKRDLSDAEFIALCQSVAMANLTKERT
jgi:hypothetical protein